MFQTFYSQFPNFDWKFYISYYPDLNKANIKTEEQAIRHYIKYGRGELRRTHTIVNSTSNIPIINANEIFNMAPQLYISKSLEFLIPQIQHKYNVGQYANPHSPACFFGVYTDKDIQTINKHQHIKFIIWGGEDANITKKHSDTTVKEIKRIHNCVHIAISQCIFKSLTTVKLRPILIDFNVVNFKLFKPIKYPIHPTTIFIYNGIKLGRENIYGSEYYLKIMNLLPQYHYILSNTLQVPNHKMPAYYGRCFIALRLTSHDGNANMVQECAAMNIPVVHNHSLYGLKWKNINDVMFHIQHYASFVSQY